MALVLAFPAPVLAPARPVLPAAAKVLGWGFGSDNTTVTALDGNDLFVADARVSSASKVVELNATTGAFVRMISGPEYGFDEIADMVADGPDLLVLSGGCNDAEGDAPGSLAEINASTGQLVKLVSRPFTKFDDPQSMVLSGNDLWIVDRGCFISGASNPGQGSVMELNPSTGALRRKIFNPNIDTPLQMALYGHDFFVVNNPNGSYAGWVTEMDASTGAVVRVMDQARYQFDSTDALAIYRNNLFVANAPFNNPNVDSGQPLMYPSLTEVNAATGALIRVMSSSKYDLDGPGPMVVDGTDLFVANGSWLTEVNAATGAPLRVINGQFLSVDDLVVAGPHLFVGNYEPGSVTEIDASSGAMVRFISTSGYQFAGPDAVAADGPDVFVANYDGNSVTEVDARTGALLRVISGAKYYFDRPDAITVNGPDVFVANYHGNSITELNASTGAMVRFIIGPKYQFEGPQALAVDGPDLFVANELGAYEGWVTEVDASTGALVRVITGPHYDIANPVALVIDGRDLFVAVGGSYGGKSGDLTEIDDRTGALVRVISAPQYEFAEPAAMVFDRGDLFVANKNGPVTEVNPTTGALVRLVQGGRYLNQPDAITGDGPYVLVANTDAGNSAPVDSVEELAASTGAVVRVFVGPEYLFDGPSAMVVAAGRLVVANEDGGSATVLSLT
jgi:outer membrane protein assembly factor BamB